MSLLLMLMLKLLLLMTTDASVNMAQIGVAVRSSAEGDRDLSALLGLRLRLPSAAEKRKGELLMPQATMGRQQVARGDYPRCWGKGSATRTKEARVVVVVRGGAAVGRPAEASEGLDGGDGAARRAKVRVVLLRMVLALPDCEGGGEYSGRDGGLSCKGPRTRIGAVLLVVAGAKEARNRPAAERAGGHKRQAGGAAHAKAAMTLPSNNKLAQLGMRVVVVGGGRGRRPAACRAGKKDRCVRVPPAAVAAAATEAPIGAVVREWKSKTGAANNRRRGGGN